MATSYKESGVDIEAGDRLVQWLQNSAPPSSPHSERIVAGIGGFASLFRASFPQMKSPCLVSCTDGVGTKLKVASHFQKFDTVGQDLVAMCINDMICCGAEPLFFLDYYATGHLEVEAAKSFLSGVRAACIESNCALIGGETAEMPGMYTKGDFDCAGFSVGVVDEEQVLGKHRVVEGSRVFGLSSSGFHSNGYSLLRKVFERDLDQWREELLKPTALYGKVAQELRNQLPIQAMAHITGGGIDNILRVVPKGMTFELKEWEIPAAFSEVQKRAEMSRRDLMKTLNCGIGLAVIGSDIEFQQVSEIAQKFHFQAYDLGGITKGKTGEEPQIVLSEG